MSSISDLPIIDSLMKINDEFNDKVDEILNISADYIATITKTETNNTINIIDHEIETTNHNHNNNNEFFKILYEIYANINSCCK